MELNHALFILAVCLAVIQSSLGAPVKNEKANNKDKKIHKPRKGKSQSLEKVIVLGPRARGTRASGLTRTLGGFFPDLGYKWELHRSIQSHLADAIGSIGPAIAPKVDFVAHTISDVFGLGQARLGQSFDNTKTYFKAMEILLYNLSQAVTGGYEDPALVRDRPYIYSRRKRLPEEEDKDIKSNSIDDDKSSKKSNSPK